VQLPKLIQSIAVLAAAVILGNWYLSEYRRIRAANLPLYRAYFSLPGIIILVLIILLPVAARYLQN
jgi:hypothetical protein